ncbi:MAG: elongation factor Ts [Gammaproteobacteria bacterium]|nr:elongation factor Ts [Gammaproteobacteria bacterium]
MEISASLVRELRDRTGAGMMDCKKALVESGGNIDGAIETMRKSGVAKAEKKAGRVAAEGVILYRELAAGAGGMLLEVNCETDFVAKDENFLRFANEAADTARGSGADSVEQLGAETLAGGGGASVEEIRRQLVAKIGENISVRRIARLISNGGRVGSYTHGGRIGVLVDVRGGEGSLARDIAMHIAASRPVCVDESGLSADLLARERDIYRAQAAQSGKPADIVEKMVNGRVTKFVNEVTLLGQPFVKEPDITVGRLLKSRAASVAGFLRLEVGEGIEKKTGNFAAEVMAQARGT